MSCGTCGIQASETMQGDTGVPAGAPTTQPRCPYCQAFLSAAGAACENPQCPGATGRQRRRRSGDRAAPAGSPQSPPAAPTAPHSGPPWAGEAAALVYGHALRRLADPAPQSAERQALLAALHAIGATRCPQCGRYTALGGDHACPVALSAELVARLLATPGRNVTARYESGVWSFTLPRQVPLPEVERALAAAGFDRIGTEIRPLTGDRAAPWQVQVRQRPETGLTAASQDKLHWVRTGEVRDSQPGGGLTFGAPPELVPHLTRLLGESADNRVRHRAVQMLARAAPSDPDGRAIATLETTLLTDPDEYVRGTAATVLADSLPRAVPVLGAALLAETSPQVGKAIARTLDAAVRAGDERAVPYLLRYMEEHPYAPPTTTPDLAPEQATFAAMARETTPATLVLHTLSHTPVPEAQEYWRNTGLVPCAVCGHVEALPHACPLLAGAVDTLRVPLTGLPVVAQAVREQVEARLQAAARQTDPAATLTQLQEAATLLAAEQTRLAFVDHAAAETVAQVRREFHRVAGNTWRVETCPRCGQFIARAGGHVCPQYPDPATLAAQVLAPALLPATSDELPGPAFLTELNGVARQYGLPGRFFALTTRAGQPGVCYLDSNNRATLYPYPGAAASAPEFITALGGLLRHEPQRGLPAGYLQPAYDPQQPWTLQRLDANTDRCSRCGRPATPDHTCAVTPDTEETALAAVRQRLRQLGATLRDIRWVTTARGTYCAALGERGDGAEVLVRVLPSVGGIESNIYDPAHPPDATTPGLPMTTSYEALLEAVREQGGFISGNVLRVREYEAAHAAFLSQRVMVGEPHLLRTYRQLRALVGNLAGQAEAAEAGRIGTAHWRKVALHCIRALYRLTPEQQMAIARDEGMAHPELVRRADEHMRGEPSGLLFFCNPAYNVPGAEAYRRRQAMLRCTERRAAALDETLAALQAPAPPAVRAQRMAAAANPTEPHTTVALARIAHTDASPLVRRAALTALGTLPTTRAGETLLHIMHHGADSRERATAAQTVTAPHSLTAVWHLLAARRDHSRAVRRAARQALRNMGLTRYRLRPSSPGKWSYLGAHQANYPHVDGGVVSSDRAVAAAFRTANPAGVAAYKMPDRDIWLVVSTDRDNTQVRMAVRCAPEELQWVGSNLPSLSYTCIQRTRLPLPPHAPPAPPPVPRGPE